MAKYIRPCWLKIKDNDAEICTYPVFECIIEFSENEIIKITTTMNTDVLDRTIVANGLDNKAKLIAWFKNSDYYFKAEMVI